MFRNPTSPDDKEGSKDQLGQTLSVCKHDVLASVQREIIKSQETT